MTSKRIPEGSGVSEPVVQSVIEATPKVGAGDRFSIVVARFNQPVTDRLLKGAVSVFERNGVGSQQLTVVRVPGAFELPRVAQRLAQSGSRAVVVLGAVIRGETPHFDFVAAESARGCGQVALVTGVPIVFGVLTTDSIEQALARAGGDHGNKGADAAETALELAALDSILISSQPVDSR